MRKNNSRESHEIAESWNTVLCALSIGTPSQLLAGAQFLIIPQVFSPEVRVKETGP